MKQKIDNNEIDSLVNNDNVISSNFYEALNGLDLHSENTVVEFMAEWSCLYPSTSDNSANGQTIETT